jgi:hypothetical protein
LKDIISLSAGEASQQALRALTKLCNFFIVWPTSCRNLSFIIWCVSLDSQLNIWYLDDGTLADYPEVVLSDFKKFINLSRKIGLELNFNKSFAVLETLTSIHVNSTLEPNGLSRDDGKRPDWMTLVPWIKDQLLVWDVTIVDTLAESYVLKTSEDSGFAAEMACKRTHSKSSSIISSNYVFKAL